MNYKIEGTPNSPVLIFSNSLGSTIDMWEELVPYLLPYFRVLRYDTRGHGGSPVTSEPYTIEQLGNDLINLMDHLSIEKAYFCGLSMGGLIGQWLGIHKPERFYKIVLSNTGAKIGDNEGWNSRIKTITEKGLEAIVDATIDRWFTEEFKANNPKRISQTREMFLSSPVLGYANCCAAIRDTDFRKDLSRLSVKTLVITGDQDLVTNVEHADYLVAQIPDASLKVLPARHLAATELPEKYAEVLVDFLVGESTFERGMHVRRTVLGNAHVDRASAKINEFNGDFQEFISHYAWGEIWTRPGLEKKERSILTLGLMIALNRASEFKMHVRAAFNNGLTKEEIKEIIMHASIYCGLPAANEAIHLAEEVLMDMGNQ